MDNAVALKFNGGILFRNVRPLKALLEELLTKNILHLHLDPQKMKYGSWDIVLVFKDQQEKEQYENGSVEYNPFWVPGLRKEVQRINPLKAAKRAARRS